MSFTQHTWTSGEKITAGKMNNLEAGVTEAMSSAASGKVTDTDGTLDKSYNDILAMVNAGILPFMTKNEDASVYRLNLLDSADYAINFYAYSYGDETDVVRWYIPPDGDLTAPMILD